MSSVPLQQVLRHQQSAFSHFFAGRAKYPTFKSKHHRQSATFCPSTVTISKDASGRYFVSCLCEFEPESLPVSAKTTGIDRGLKDVFVTDSGFKTGNLRHTAKYAKRLALLQRRLSKKQKGSYNRARAKLKVAKIADYRRDNLHKLSRRLINENQVVCVESLKVKNMIRNPMLSKAIADAGWGELVRQLQYKADWAGRSIVAVGQFFPSSKCCSSCGYRLSKLALSTRS